MEFRVLGPLEVRSDDVVLPLGTRRQRAVLAALLSTPNETVGRSRLIDLVWDEPPASADANLRGYVAKLREALREEGAEPRLTWEDGARLRVEPGELDAQRFEDAAADGRKSLAEARPADAVRAFEKALGLVRGEPYQDVSAGVDFEASRAFLRERRMNVTELYFQARLDLGEHTEIIDELRLRLARHPAREGLAALLMTALYRSRRGGDALAVYRDIRARLVDELGSEPGRDLQELHRRILRADPGLDGTAAARGICQLPLALSAFSGRRAELSLMDAAGSVTVVTGTAGVGKTTLAVHWAHSARNVFPDGQLYVDLRGFMPGEAPLDPGEVLHGFLDVLGVPTARIPAGVDDKAARFRDLLADKCVLVVLDNARDAVQVRPLLPGGSGCRVVVTSRDRLTGLVAASSATVVPVETLPAAQARELLARRLDAARVAREAEAVDRIIDRCAGLPLALALVAARAAGSPDGSLADIAGELDAVPALDGLHSTDPAMDPRTLFTWSYRRLGTAAARMFQLLGDHPGPDFSLPAAASMAGLDHGPARSALDELVEAHLLIRHGRGRYGRHDLLTAFAAELATVESTREERDAALLRMYDHYAGTAHHAAALLDPKRPSPPGAPPPAEALGTADEALAWLSAEYPVLIGAVAHVHRHGLHGHAWRLAWALVAHQIRTDRLDDWIAAQRTAVEAATDAGDTAALAAAHRQLAMGLHRAGRITEGDAAVGTAMELFERLGDRFALAELHFQVGRGHWQAGNHRGLVDSSHRAFTLLREHGHVSGQARALNSMAWGLMELGELDEALDRCRAALDLFAEADDDPQGESNVWHTLGSIEHRLGEHTRAAGSLRKSIDMHRSRGYIADLVPLLTDLAAAYDAMGAHEEAEETRRELAATRAELG